MSCSSSNYITLQAGLCKKLLQLLGCHSMLKETWYERTYTQKQLQVTNRKMISIKQHQQMCAHQHKTQCRETIALVGIKSYLPSTEDFYHKVRKFEKMYNRILLDLEIKVATEQNNKLVMHKKLQV